MNASRRHIVMSLLLALLLTHTTSCGYFMHPDRVGQKGGELDPSIIILDAAGLLFGILPGVVAFAVDITTGAIYLAPGEQSIIDKHKKHHSLNTTLPSFLPHLMEAQALPSDSPTLTSLDISRIAAQLSQRLEVSVSPEQLSFHAPRQSIIYAMTPPLTTPKG